MMIYSTFLIRGSFLKDMIFKESVNCIHNFCWISFFCQVQVSNIHFLFHPPLHFVFIIQMHLRALSNSFKAPCTLGCTC